VNGYWAIVALAGIYAAMRVLLAALDNRNEFARIAGRIKELEVRKGAERTP
jgi:hypothetical protein